VKDNKAPQRKQIRIRRVRQTKAKAKRVRGHNDASNANQNCSPTFLLLISTITKLFEQHRETLQKVQYSGVKRAEWTQSLVEQIHSAPSICPSTT